MKFRFVFLLVCIFGKTNVSDAQIDHSATTLFTRADTLRGSIGTGRDWWDVTEYIVLVEPDYNNKSIRGKTDIGFKVIKPGKLMQIDLQEPMKLTNAYLGDIKLNFKREGNVFFIEMPTELTKGSTHKLALAYEGNVTIAKKAPWDGGWIFTKDKLGRPWMTVACQGLGASVWFPCKDHQGDEPENGSTLKISVPDSLVAVGNGRLISKKIFKQGWTTYEWKVINPINNYNIIPYIGKYVEFGESYPGVNGKLDCSYWVMDYNIDKAKVHFNQVPFMLKAFESSFGPYPFYEDSYKLVETPHLGMEHQSAVAYGNEYMNGYRGRDLSGTGWGNKWDFIIVHESGHEWFGNSITANDIADMWIHEGFTNYSETVFTTFQHGKEAGDAYVQGTRKLIANETPIIGYYGVNNEGSGDMYYKGGNLIHYVKQLFDNDENFFVALREMNKQFFHQIVTTKQIENFWSNQTGKDLSRLFDQYLRNTAIPILEVKKINQGIQYKWTNCIKGYNAPVKIILNGQPIWVNPQQNWQSSYIGKNIDTILLDPNFYCALKQIE
jgi:aminopeptidase N